MTHVKIEVTAELVRDLVRDQHPDLADLPVRLGARGWDNQLWRLGDDLAVRLPWATQDADELLLKEHALLPAIAPRLPLQIPVPQRLGRPSERFPRLWIVTTWVAGEPADRTPVTRGAEAADLLAAFLAALHQPAPDDAPAGRNRRGGRLADIDHGVAHLLKEATDRRLISDPDALRGVWEDALAAPIHQSYASADAATVRRARGWALSKALACLLIADDGVHGRPGGKPTWGPPAYAALRHLVTTIR
jgi:hypothetical protein